MRVEFDVCIDTIERVKKFADYAMKAEKSEILVKSPTRILDGKSILSLFSLDITKVLKCVIKSDSETDIDTFYHALERDNMLVV